jgi:beta-glucosidase
MRACCPVIAVGEGGREIVPEQDGMIPRTQVYHAPAPRSEIEKQAPQTQVVFADGRDQAEAAELAKTCDVAIVFAVQWATEAEDLPSLSLPDEQDALISAVAAASSKTVVVLETGTPVLMPWLDQVGGVLQAWYSGTRGGEAIARVLFGEVNPSGRLPITFPQSTAELVRPDIPGQIFGPPVEGATIPTLKVLFPFGFGLSYSAFEYANLKVAGGDTATVTFDVTNSAQRAGIETAQVYARVSGGQRLIGWARVALKPGETKSVRVVADPRLLANYDTALPGWRIDPGAMAVCVQSDSTRVRLSGQVELKGANLAP